ncbi:23S rRNA (guanine(745)-N(1))-methyltransferase [Rubripirellula amarantea]|uniref:23S rRNA (Guanine(745)-N(1))-methyltransferase n=1 Tax=Rubripirellula amarantea TaxID=2527999 RepID=A0A5C5WYI0_9BACT|nr:methyltransferase domain-containing protein [Rubripirellula amarantea]TWT55053.1 23S rRNA (guanine(745)-N(1))-methyltransferase [Rubripirellula amarantea]
MFELRCTVRNCQHLLKLIDGALRCESGHHFDRAKQGYWNLLQPQDRKSKNPGDCESAVMARHRWLERGYATDLIETLRLWTETDSETTAVRTVDLGCGEGTFGPALFSAHPELYCGIELSKQAIKIAARRWADATWVLANADRTLPAADGSVGRVMSLFGRRPIREIKRVLAPGGVCIVAVPGEDDLIELREQVQQAAHRRSRWEVIVDEMAAEGMTFVEHRLWQQSVVLDPDAIGDAMAMTYRAVRHSQQSRLETLDTMPVTLSADLMLFRA